MSRSDPARPASFDAWIAEEFAATGAFTALVVLIGIGELTLTPLRSTWLHVIGTELDWPAVARPARRQRRRLGRRALRPAHRPRRRAAARRRRPDRAPRLRPAGDRGPHRAERRALLRPPRPAHEDRGGPRPVTPSLRLLDTGLADARWNVGYDRGALRAARRRPHPRYPAPAPLPPLPAPRREPARRRRARRGPRGRAPHHRRRGRAHDAGRPGLGPADRTRPPPRADRPCTRRRARRLRRGGGVPPARRHRRRRLQACRHLRRLRGIDPAAPGRPASRLRPRRAGGPLLRARPARRDARRTRRAAPDPGVGRRGRRRRLRPRPRPPGRSRRARTSRAGPRPPAGRGARPRRSSQPVLATADR